MNSKQIDLVFLDVNTQDVDHIELLKTINYKNMHCIVVTNFVGKELVLSALHAGIQGFLHKGDDLNELINCINSVLKGEKHYNNFAKEIALSNIEIFNVDFVLRFRKHEIDVLSLMRNGKDSAEIAEALRCTEKVVRKRRFKMLQKSRARNAAALMAYAIDNGILKNSGDS